MKQNEKKDAEWIEREGKSRGKWGGSDKERGMN